MKYWVFDLDDTLVATKNGLPSALRRALAHFGLNAPDSEFDRLRRSTPIEYFTSKVGKARAEEAYRSYLAELEISVSQVRPFAGVQACLERLQRRGKSLALWTGRDRNSAEKILTSSGMLSLFDVRCYGCDSFQQKPNAEGFRFILQSLGAAPKETVMVGDHEYDLHGPRDLGSVTVHAQWSLYRSELPFQATHTFREFADFCHWVETF